MEDLRGILESALEKIGAAKTEIELSETRAAFVGKNGSVTALMKQMRDLSAEERPKFGQMVNELKNGVEQALAERANAISVARRAAEAAKDLTDVTMPAVKPLGALHPLTQVYLELRDIFMNMGFDVNEGPEIESDKNNFEMLNIPKDHPARDMQDTFYITDDVVLRTHTSPVQIRTMLKQKPPIRMVCPGRVYRSDDVDATHSPVFNQMEGLVVDKGITFANLKYTIDTFLKELYGEKTKTKFRPGFFPFTEPSAEVDATCSICGGTGCSSCKGAGVIELLGCGMVHPNVLRNCGIDPDVYSGFAFGMGLDRIANIKYGITDIRLQYENDLRFLTQFK